MQIQNSSSTGTLINLTSFPYILEKLFSGSRMDFGSFRQMPIGSIAKYSLYGHIKVAYLLK
jgi:hypothetical protein